MTARRRFTAEFKARVALAALRGDKTIQGRCHVWTPPVMQGKN